MALVKYFRVVKKQAKNGKVVLDNQTTEVECINYILNVADNGEYTIESYYDKSEVEEEEEEQPTQ